MSREPTPRQLEVLRATACHMRQHGVVPTNRELGRALGGITTNAVFCHLETLERKGLIRTGRKSKLRALWITEAGLQLLGIACPYCTEVPHAE